MTKSIGFACKWIDRPDQVDGISPKDECKQYNTGGTTVAWLNRQSKQAAEDKLWDLMKGNIESVRKLVERVGGLDNELRMVRLSSGVILELAGMQNRHLGKSEIWLEKTTLGCLFILVSSPFLLAIIQISSTVQ